MKRAARIALYVLAGFAAGLVAAVVVVFVLTRTEFGMERVRGVAVKWLDEKIEGQLEVGQISGAGLLGGVTLHDFTIKGPPPEGRPFLQADSAKVEYRWRSLLLGQIQLQNVRVYGPRVVVEKLPGDTAWNYEYIFVDKTPGESGPRRLVDLHDVEIMNGFVTVRRPYETIGRIEVSDTVRMIMEKQPEGLATVMHFDSLNARLSRVLWESPIEKGRLFEIDRLAGVVYVFKEPLAIDRLGGQVVLRDTMIASDSRPVIGFDLKPVEFGGSRAEMVGRVIQERRRNVVDVSINGKQLVFDDLHWLYPNLPDKGNATLQLRIQSQPKGTLFYASNARITAPGTNVSGDFGIVTGDTMYFTDVDLKASPLNLDWLEGVLPRKLPVDGLMVGTVEVKGPISRLDTRGDIRITPANAGPASWLKWSGVFNATDRFAASNFRADVGNLDLAVLNALRPELNLKGSVRGHIEGEGRLSQDFRFAADLHHELAGMASRYEGSGTYSSNSKELDVRLNAMPLSFEQLSNAYPALQKLRGEARGPISLRGPTDNLHVDARLATVGGELQFNGALQTRDGRRRYSGEARVLDYQLDRLLAELPRTNLSGVVQFDLAGTSVQDVNGTLNADLEQARVSGTLLKDVKLSSHLRDGQIFVDSLQALSPLGNLAARGEFGITENRSGTVDLTVHSDSLTAPEGSDALTGGQLDLRATLRGGVTGFDLDADGLVRRAVYARASAQRLLLNLAGRSLATDSSALQLTFTADTADIYGEKLDTITAQLDYRQAGGSLTVRAGNHERGYRLNADVLADSSGVRLGVQNASGGLLAAPWVLQSPFAVQLTGTSIRADSFAFRQVDGAGSAAGAGHLAWARSREDSVAAAHEPLDFRLGLQRVPINEYLRFLRISERTDGSIDANVVVNGTAGAPIITADASFTNLRYGDARFERVNGSFSYAGQRIEARVRGEHEGRERLIGEGRIPMDLGFVPVRERRLEQPLEFSIRTDGLPASVVTGMVRSFRDVEGVVSGTLDLHGTSKDPTIAGQLTLRNGAATFNASGVRYRNVEGTFNVLNDSVVAIEAQARAGEGRATLKGNMVFAPLSNPSFGNITIDATRFAAAARRDADLAITGQLTLGGRFRAPVLGGQISVDRGELNLDELYRQTQIVQLDPSRPFFRNVIDTSIISLNRILPVTSNPFVRNLQIENLAIDVGRETWLRSRALNVEVTGRLLVALDRANLDEARNVQDIRLAGELSAVRGTYQLDYPPFTRRFQIREGTVEFPGTPGLDPNLAITTVYRARPLEGEPIDILALVNGTLLSPRIRLSSERDPPISESDLASYLFFGVPTSALSLAQSRSLAAFSGPLGGAGGLTFNALRTSTLGYLAGGLQSLAQDYNLLDYLSLTAARGSSEASQNPVGFNFNSFLADTRLEVGRYIPPFFVIYSQQLASSTSGIGVRVEWRFLPTYTLEVFTEDRFSRGRPLGIENSAAFRRVYGFFLFKEWSY